ncbi:hypothetical protein SDC9_154189 [bioreactor metagenome]|uniref:Uncharacterized protein n=1 Tax=bioreactor metagenome TaxID=1076179 RepID=A0A645F0A3_9ZZZZ
MLRLFVKGSNPVALIRIHDAEAMRLLHGNRQHGDGRHCVLLNVEVQHCAIVHLIDMIPRQNQNIFRIILIDKLRVLIDCVCGSGIPSAIHPRHIGRQHKHAAVHAVEIPVLSGADVAIQRERPILRQDADGVNIGIHAVAQREINNAIFAPERHGGFCHAGGKHAKAASLSAGEQHCDNPFFHASSSCFASFFGRGLGLMR